MRLQTIDPTPSLSCVQQGKVTAKQKARAAMDSLDDRAYVVIGEEIPADIHINWGERAAVHELFE